MMMTTTTTKGYLNRKLHVTPTEDMLQMTRKSCHFIPPFPTFASSSCRPKWSGCSQGLAWCRSWTAALRSRRGGIQRVLGVQICQRWEETKEVTEVTGRSTLHLKPEFFTWKDPLEFWKHPDEDLAGFFGKTGMWNMKRSPEIIRKSLEKQLFDTFRIVFFFFCEGPNMWER